MHFEFVKRLKTTKNSIFYSFIHYNDKILAVGRRKYDERVIKFMLVDRNFDVLKDNEQFLIRGEDPRCFYHNGEIYIQDNYWNDMYLINLSKQLMQKVDVYGKNISFISHNSRLYFIYYMCPFVLYEYCIETGEIFPINVHQDYYDNFQYRGGTPGYKLCDNVYYGFGHRTYEKENEMYHDVFYWEVTFGGDKPFIEIWNIQQPPNSLKICDPTSVIEMDGKFYLITAESHRPWFQDQEYETNIYQIIR